MLPAKARMALYAVGGGCWLAAGATAGNGWALIPGLVLVVAALGVMPDDRAIRKDSEQLEELDVAMSDLKQEVEELGSWLEDRTYDSLVLHACSDDEMVWDPISDQYEWACPHLGLLYC